MARVRTSPYLPGVRSRLWRLVTAVPEAPSPTANGTVPEGPASQASLALDEAARPAGRPNPAAPVLAVFRRLPFDEGA